MRSNGRCRSLLLGLALLALVGLFLAPGTADAKKPPPPPDDPPTAADPDPAIVFALDDSGVWKIYVMNDDGSNLTKLVDVPGYPWVPCPRWSPDGTKIAFVGADGENVAVFTVGADGSGRTKIMSGYYSSVWDLDWTDAASPDGSSKISATFTDVPGGESDLWVMNEDGSGLTNLTGGAYGDVMQATWAPDGKRVLISSFGSPPTLRILTLGTDASGELTIMSAASLSDIDVGGGKIQDVAWARTADRLAFSVSAPWGRYTTWDVWTVSLDDLSNPVRLTPYDGNNDLWPRWSSDDDSLVFQRVGYKKDGALSGIWTMNSSGSNPAQLTYGLGRMMPDWK